MPDIGQVRRPSRAAYALPSLFTAGNIFLGYLAILRTIEGSLLVAGRPLEAAEHFSFAAKVIGLSVLLDGLDGRVARMTNTTSAFGAELDSLADAISFGIAPALLAYCWGVQFVDAGYGAGVNRHLLQWGKLVSFLFLLCGVARLARFNVQKNPMPKNPGRPHRKYFVGLPIPAGAGMIAAVAYFADGYPMIFWQPVVLWLCLVGLLSFLMVSTWRYNSFKDLNLLRPRSPLTVVLLGGIIFLLWNYSQPALLILASAYVGSGVLIRAGGMLRRLRPSRPPEPEHQVG
ncbi:MAG: CDP-diacylglycerol--serine O-phosphatidyltransferase [Acidobacteriota bacterium]|nr:CDP-diacylglycerol--serine O-phosphatidyltransferase [Acidobacteriota bacterium]